VAELKAKRTGVQYDGVSASDFLDTDFRSFLAEKAPNTHCEVLAFTVFKKKDGGKEGDEDYEHIVVGHPHHSSAKKKELTVDTDSPEALEKIVEVIEAFLKAKGRT
jgi:hypothetical protein